MQDETFIPISDEQAKAGQEVVKALGGLGSFVKQTLGTVPEDLVGYLGGDWLRFRRIENIAKLMDLTKQRLEAWKVEPQHPATLSLTLPILRAAADESREDLQDLWARLLAATIDPSKGNLVRRQYIEVISKMDPPDAVLLKHLKHRKIEETFDLERKMHFYQESSVLGIPEEEIYLSLKNLVALGLISEKQDYEDDREWRITFFGKKLLQVVADPAS